MGGRWGGRLGGGWVGGRIRGGGRGGIWRVWRREQRGRGSVRRLVKPGPGLRNEAKMLSTDTKLTELVKRLKEFAASNLECVILFGSADRGDFRWGHSDLNVGCILRSL